MSKKIVTSKRIKIILSFILVVFLINISVSYLIKSKINNILLENPIDDYTITFSNIDFKLLRQSISLNDIEISPKSESLENLMEEDIDKQKLDKIFVNSIAFKSINFFKFLTNRNIVINEIEIDHLNFHTFKNTNITEKRLKKANLNVDSIHIKGINGLTIKHFTLNQIQFEAFDFKTSDITFSSAPLDLKMGGLTLLPNGENNFKLQTIQESFSIKGVAFDNTDYSFSLEAFNFDKQNKYWELKNLSFHPKTDKFQIAATKTYNDDIIDLDIKQIQLHQFNLENLINGKGLFIDSVKVAGANIEIFKDKRKPFNTNKRPGLPHIKLKQSNLPILIEHIKLENCNLLVQEKLKEKDLLMEVPIEDINASIYNITSIKEYRNNPITADITAKLMKSGNVHAKASFNMQDNNHRFYFNGTLGQCKLELFDSALYPVLGLKVIKGNLDKLTFQGSANTESSTGSMTMLYHDLEADVFKSDSLEENKLLTWGVNTLILESNPKKGKAPREVVMNFERVPYKGLGNYFWKTIQSGVINTLNPVGKKVKNKKKK